MAEDEKKVKKLEKVIEGTIVKITEGITGEELLFDFAAYPPVSRRNSGLLASVISWVIPPQVKKARKQLSPFRKSGMVS